MATTTSVKLPPSDTVATLGLAQSLGAVMDFVKLSTEEQAEFAGHIGLPAAPEDFRAVSPAILAAMPETEFKEAISDITGTLATFFGKAKLVSLFEIMVATTRTVMEPEVKAPLAPGTPPGIQPGGPLGGGVLKRGKFRFQVGG